MTITINSHGFAAGNTKTGLTIAAGNLIVVAVFDEGMTASTHNTVTDNATVPNTYTFLSASAASVGAGNFGNFGGVAFYYCLNCHALSNNTITLAGGAAAGIAVWDASTTTGSWSLDTAATNAKTTTSNSTSVSQTSGTPTAAGEAFFLITGFTCSISSSETITGGNGWGSPSSTTGTLGGEVASQVNAGGTATTLAATLSHTGQYGSAIAAFSASAAPITANPVVTTLKAPTQSNSAAEVEPSHITTTLKAPTQSGTIQVNNAKANITTTLPLWSPTPVSEWTLLNSAKSADDQFGTPTGGGFFGGNIPAGSLVVILAIGEGGTGLGSGSVTDTQGNTYVGGGTTYSVAPDGDIANGVLHAFWGITTKALTSSDSYFVGFGPPALYICSAWSGAEIDKGGASVVDCIALDQTIGSDIASGAPAASGDLFIGMTYALHNSQAVSSMTVPSGWAQIGALAATNDTIDNVEGQVGAGMSYLVNGQLSSSAHTFNSSFNGSTMHGAQLVISFRRAPPIQTVVGNVNNDVHVTTANPVVTTLPSITQSFNAVEREPDTIVTTLKAITQSFVAIAPPDGRITTNLKSLAQSTTVTEIEPARIVTTLFSLSQIKHDTLVETSAITTTLPSMAQALNVVEQERDTIITTLPGMQQTFDSHVSPGGAIITTLKGPAQVVQVSVGDAARIVTTLKTISQRFDATSPTAALVQTTLKGFGQRVNVVEIEGSVILTKLPGFGSQRMNVLMSVPFNQPPPGAFYSYWTG